MFSPELHDLPHPALKVIAALLKLRGELLNSTIMLIILYLYDNPAVSAEMVILCKCPCILILGEKISVGGIKVAYPLALHEQESRFEEKHAESFSVTQVGGRVRDILPSGGSSELLSHKHPLTCARLGEGVSVWALDWGAGGLWCR